MKLMLNKNTGENRVDSLTELLRWGAPFTPHCVRELDTSHSDNKFPKAIIPRDIQGGSLT